jgi:hypothetical protein
VDKPIDASSDETALRCLEDSLHVPVVRFYRGDRVLPDVRKMPVTCQPHIYLRHPLLFNVGPERLRPRHHSSNILETLCCLLRDSFRWILRLLQVHQRSQFSQCPRSSQYAANLHTSVLLPNTAYMPEAKEDGDVRENLIIGEVQRELAASRSGHLGEMAAHNTKQRLTTSYLVVLISACVSSTMNALGCHSGLAPTAFLFNSVIQGERSICLLLFVMMKAIGTPLRHLSNTISVYKGNCTHGIRT